MVDWNKKFKPEYDAAKAAIAGSNNFDRGWQPLVQRLGKLMGDQGFDAGHEEALSELRRKVTEAPSQTRITEDKGILQAVGAWTDSDTGTVDGAAKTRAAALKMLRHIYLQNKAGNRKVWILSLPNDFTDWPTRMLKNNASSAGRVKQLLAASNGHFTDQQRRFLGHSTQQAMAWCHRAGMTLTNAASGTAGPDRTAGRAMVSRWFAEPGLSESALNSTIATLTQGFKDIVARLGKGHFVLTDWVPFRGTSDADELDFLASEAFTFRSTAEGMDVVYIESSFFAPPGSNVLSGQANWTRILVHELTHLVCGTEDVNNGDTRYAWYGIGPHAGYPNSDCVRNAENWAFFAADCGAALSDSERTTALRIR